MTVPFCPDSDDSVPLCPDFAGTGLARVRNRDMSRCPVPSRSFPSAAGPAALHVLSKMRVNYEKAGKLIEAKAIKSAIAAIKKESEKSWLTELESTLASPAQSLSWPEIEWPPRN